MLGKMNFAFPAFYLTFTRIGARGGYAMLFAIRVRLLRLLPLQAWLYSPQAANQASGPLADGLVPAP